ncbi:hypothetical protein GJU40_10565 [Bacillus lacus]|uniref:PNPLA domain-containing protein n=1 Tax=Metabacillus lacus TaxID=1983721 RepID=A0A7X2M0A5_9BACI|nr:patatin-like phospholipase family protein [Metabacillus lacus]MRX72589.1 hypothetical protein [Metabacillus lacus]
MYIDGVFSGGGIKGLAFAGAFEAVEKRGLKYVRVAGTSAGSIVAAFIAAGYNSSEVREMLEELELSSFLDERKTLIPSKIWRWVSIYWRLGLYRGNKLEQWIAQKLKNKNVSTFGDLKKGALRIIASDITNGRMMVLPDDLISYGIMPESFSIARAVRMSCSLPYFFEPVKLTASEGVSLVVDGGVLSNFPIWLFCRNNHQMRPVLGIKLSSNDQESSKHKITNAFELYNALFETMKNAHDARHISSKHEKNIVFIPVDHVLTTEFGLTEQKKLALVELGRSKTEEFLRRWAF